MKFKMIETTSRFFKEYWGLNYVCFQIIWFNFSPNKLIEVIIETTSLTRSLSL